MKRETSIVTWEKVRADVLKVNKELGEIIDDISPSDDYKFVKVKYLYGDLFVENGEAQFAVNDELASLSNAAVDKEIQKELFYNTMPLFLVLEKSAELFVNAGKRIVPINLFHKGSLSGIYEAMDYMMGRKSDPIWNFSAGSRSVFMLPKITDKHCFEKLSAAYDIPMTVQIKKLSDHWKVFKHIAQNTDSTQQWQSTILYFGKKWLDNKEGS